MRNVFVGWLWFGELVCLLVDKLGCLFVGALRLLTSGFDGSRSDWHRVRLALLADRTSVELAR